MSTATYRPTSDTYAGLTPYGSGTGNYGRVNEVTEDISNGVYSLSNFDVYGFGLSNLGTLNSITVHAKCWVAAGNVTGSPTVRLINFNSGTYYYGSYNALTSTDTDYSYSFTTHLAWTNAFGLELVGGSDGTKTGALQSYSSQVWIVVDYTGAGWTHIAKWNGVATSTIKTINGVAVANIKSINGVAV
jgi:hypothetical protein